MPQSSCTQSFIQMKNMAQSVSMVFGKLDCGRQIKNELQKAGYGAGEFDAVVGRGGLLPPVASGTYLVDDVMLEQIRLARRGEHASNLGGVLAHLFAKAAGVNAFVRPGKCGRMAGVRANFRVRPGAAFVSVSCA